MQLAVIIRAGWLSGLAVGLAIQGARAADQALVTYKHVGVGSCASTTCHGKVAPDTSSQNHVRLDEYKTWHQLDLHAKAYSDLDGPHGRAIAAKLGLASARVPECLDCHTDNVPRERQALKFRIEDGVGCEACHGGAEKWLETHAARSPSHADNVRNGMTPLEVAWQRAEVCSTCHVGTPTKYVTHQMYGAGHVRLTFDLEWFSANEPPHYDTANDRFLQHPARINLWVAGQFAAAERYLQLVQIRLTHPASLFPQLSLYDCQGCHHSTDDIRWTSSRAGQGIAPGTVRLQKTHLVILQALAEAVDSPAAANDLAGLRQALVRAGQTDAESAHAAAAKALEWIHGHQDWASRKFTAAEQLTIRRTLLNYAASDEGSDYIVAEQLVLSIDSVSDALGDREAKKAPLNELFAAINKSATFAPSRFADVARKVRGQF